jgi:hypothetical protein
MGGLRRKVWRRGAYAKTSGPGAVTVSYMIGHLMGRWGRAEVGQVVDGRAGNVGGYRVKGVPESMQMFVGNRCGWTEGLGMQERCSRLRSNSCEYREGGPR